MATLSAEDFGGLLARLLTPDTNIVRQAEANLKPYLKNPLCLGGLLQQIQSNPEPGVRQIAAVIMRRKVSTHWAKLDANTHLGLQNALLQILQSEGVRPVRKAIVSVAAAVANKCFAHPDTHWNTILEFVNACATAPQEEAREMGFQLLEQMASSIGTSLSGSAPSLVPLLLSGLSDASPLVRAEALTANGEIMEALAESGFLDHFAPTLVPMLTVIKSSVESGDDSVAVAGLESLVELIECFTPNLDQAIPQIVGMMLELVKLPDVEAPVRDTAGMVLSSIAQTKPKVIGKGGLVPQMLEAMVTLIAESPCSAAGSLFMALNDGEHDPEDQEEYEGPTACSIAEDCLDRLGCSLPMKYVWSSGLQLVVHCLQQPESRWKKAGAACLGELAEGCQDPLREELGTLLPMVLSAAQDPDRYSRESACFCLGQICEHCQPEIMTYQGQVLPVMFALLDDERASVKGIACYVLESFGDHLTQENVAPYLHDLVGKLVSLSQNPRLAIQEMSMATLSAVAHAAGELFMPYAAQVAGMLAGPLQTVEERFFNLRGRALECLGHVALGIKKDAFAPYLAMGMQSAEQALQLDSSELHEYSYSFFGNIAKAMGSDFAPFLGTLIPHMCEVIARVDIKSTPIDDDGHDLEGLIDSEEEEENPFTYLSIGTGELETKKTAVLALGLIAEHSGPSFTTDGHLETAMTTLMQVIEYFHSKVRREVMLALRRMVNAVVVGRLGVGGKVNWTPGQVVPLESIDPLIAHVGSFVVKLLVVVMADDADKTVVSEACAGLQEALDLLGPGALGPVGSKNWSLSEGQLREETVFDVVLALLYEKAMCQAGPQFEQAQLLEDEDEEDHDNILMDNVADLVGIFAKVMGPQFAGLAPQYIDAMMKFSKESRPASDRAMAIGCFAEITEFMGEAAAPHVPVLFDAVRRGLKDNAYAVRRNSAFACGMLMEANSDFMRPHFMSILTDLQPLLQPQEGMEYALVDNVTSAMGRILKFGMDLVPAAQVVPAFVNNLPLKQDMQENKNVYSVLAWLFELKAPDLAPSLPHAVFAAAASLQVEENPDEVKQRLVTAIRTAMQDPQWGQAIHEALGQLPADAAAVLRPHLQ